MNNVYQKYYTDENNKNKQFDIYAYGPPYNTGWYKIDGKDIMVGEDMRTPERYLEYKETGFNILHAQDSGCYNGEEWEGSRAQIVLDAAQKAGLDRVIIVDERIRLLSCEKDGLVGEGKKFNTQEELDEYIAFCMKPYKDHPCFYAVQFLDEPIHRCFKAMGELVKAIRKTAPKTFIKCNLFPIVVLSATDAFYPEGGDMYDRYERYFNAFIDQTGLDYIMYDNYPIYNGELGQGQCFYRFYFRALQIAAKVCKERNVKFYFVAQSCGFFQNRSTTKTPIRYLTVKTPNQDEMFYQINAILGFGVKRIAYYTYMTGRSVATIEHNSAMLTRSGEKTPLYGYVQNVNKMIQKLAPVILNFDYVADRYIIKPPFKSHPFHLEYTTRGFLNNVIDAETSHEVALINEMYDKERDQWLYRVQNITYNYYEETAGIPPQTTTIKFKEGFTKVDVFDGENWRTVELKDGTYTTAPLKAGYAEYLLPY